jgi:hypothetical protein
MAQVFFDISPLGAFVVVVSIVILLPSGLTHIAHHISGLKYFLVDSQ